MVDAAGYGGLLAALNWLYWLVAAIAVWLAWRTFDSKSLKRWAALTVAVLFLLPAASRVYQTATYQWKYRQAKALFDERCKTAGERIYRTVEGVEGVFLMNLRDGPVNFSDQYKLNDPYGYAGSGENYIKLFIRGRSTVPTKIGEIVDSKNIVTYEFAEAKQADHKGFIRYSTSMSKEDSERVTRNGGGTVPIRAIPVDKLAAKYGIAWADISSKEDRDNWIAGGSLKIIDLSTNEVIAERIGYMFDKGLGNTGDGRSPWAFARDNACPTLNEKSFYFFDRVLKPKY